MNADKTVKLEHGTVEIFERGDVRVHAYITHDAIDDVCLVLEHAGQAAVIELPPFKENIAELERYIAGLGVKTVAKIVDYHAAGDTFMHDVPAYSTEEANEYNTTGGGAGLIKGFISSFGAGFDSSVRLGEKILKAGKTQIAGIEMEILPTARPSRSPSPRSRPSTCTCSATTATPSSPARRAPKRWPPTSRATSTRATSSS